MRGLVAYGGDSQSDSESQPSSSRDNDGASTSRNTHDKSSKFALKSPGDHRRATPLAQVVIRRPATTQRTQTRAHISDDINPEDRYADALHQAGDSTPMDISPPSSHQGLSEEPIDELFRIRALLRPPPIPGVQDWGIPPPSSEPCDPAIVTKLAQFQALKRDPSNPRHFNDSLMSNRSFRNPHLYANLVDWADVDEKATNFPTDIWDPSDVLPEWFADKIAEAQKRRTEKGAAAHAAGKRTQIDFTNSSSSGRAQDKNQDSVSARKSRFQPYGSNGGIKKEKGKTRWG